MRKILLLFVALCISVLSFCQTKYPPLKCQQHHASMEKGNTWALAQDFTLLDLNANQYHLQEYLDVSKYVLVSLSTAWCEASWDLHQSGMLEEIHENYGSGGTNEIQVLWIEIEKTNTTQQIMGNHTANDYSGASQGDFTVNGTWPIPIIDNWGITRCFHDLYEGVIPTLFLICPSGAYTNVTNYTANEIYALVGNCYDEESKPMADFDGILEGYPDMNIALYGKEFSIIETEKQWSCPSAVTETLIGKDVIAQWSEPGSYDVTYYVTNINGTDSITKTVIIKDDVEVDDRSVSFEECIELALDFEPYNWKSLSLDSALSQPLNMDEFPTDGKENGFVVWKPSLVNIVNEAGLVNGEKGAVVITTGCVKNNDWFISPKIQLGEDDVVKFTANSFTEAYGLERMKVGVSTYDDQPENFSFLHEEAYITLPVEKQITEFSLADYANQEVYIALQSVSDDAYLTILDDIYIGPRTNINTESLEFDIYPNPSSGMIKIVGIEKANIVVYNAMGTEVYRKNNISYNQDIDLSFLNSGSYLLKLNTTHKTSNRHIIITK